MSMQDRRGKIVELRDLGFADPAKMMTSNPEIFEYTIDTIRDKIAGLRELGFADPVKMITSSPTILSLGMANVERRPPLRVPDVLVAGVDAPHLVPPACR